MKICRTGRAEPRKWLWLLLVLLACTACVGERAQGDAIEAAFAARSNGVMVDGDGHVDRLLPDDREGSRHQRFIVELASGHTVLIAHNIDLAPRVDTLERGDRVAFRGQYEYNDRGGVVHWTHDDPDGRHPGGWIEHEGRRYR